MIKKQANHDARGGNSRPTTANTKRSKKARLEAMLSRPRGATHNQLEKALGWQPHTVRAAISRLRKSGADVILDRNGRAPAYRIDPVI